MFNIVLVQPEIPPNTGNVIRLAANTGCALHLVEPLGFAMEDRLLRRAGLDYHETARVQRHASWAAFMRDAQPARRACSRSRRAGGVSFAQVGGSLATGSSSAARPPACRRPCATPCQRSSCACRCAPASAA
jgi:tRNA (cytidine/uridine-2'-O-)-methyltransferase